MKYALRGEMIKSTQQAKLEAFSDTSAPALLVGAPQALENLGSTGNTEYVRWAAKIAGDICAIDYKIHEEAEGEGKATWQKTNKVSLDMSAYRSTEDEEWRVLCSEIDAMFIRAPFSLQYIINKTFGGELADMPFVQAMASLIHFYAHMTKNKDSTMFKRLDQLIIQVKDFVPPCSTCKTYDCHLSGSHPNARTTTPLSSGS